MSMAEGAVFVHWLVANRIIMAGMCDHFRDYTVQGVELNEAKLTENIDRPVIDGDRAVCGHRL